MNVLLGSLSPFYTAQELSQGMVLPIVGASSHLNEPSQDNPPQLCSEAHLLGDSRSHLVDKRY